MKTKHSEWIFLFVCLMLGMLAEISFLHGKIGVSYIVFIVALYAVLFVRFRFSFEHRRIGLLLMVGIWVLAGSFLLYDSTIFYILNIFIIPGIVFFHIVLITSPGNLNWSKLSFVKLVTGKMLDVLKFLLRYCKYIGRKMMGSRENGKSSLSRQVLLGLLATVPLFVIIIPLLMSADVVFRQFVQQWFYFKMELNIVEVGLRIIFILLAALFFFCVFKVIGNPTKREIEINQAGYMDFIPAAVAVTILVLLNMLYLMFLAVQFQYFFHDGLHEGFTYADYARQGFFELLTVTIINWTVLLLFIKRVKHESKRMKVVLQTLYSILIGASGVLLLSAWQRLMLYEEMYGYTLDRLLAHSFMMFLLVIFAYTLIRVWLVNLPILHFYLICAFLFYTLLNVINLEEVVVENNMERYEETGKIDVHYLDQLGAEGIKGLIYLYEQDEDLPELHALLFEHKQQITLEQNATWQSFNFTRNEVKRLLEELEL